MTGRSAPWASEGLPGWAHTQLLSSLPGCAAASQVGRRGLKLRMSDQPLLEHRSPEGAQAWDCREPIALFEKLSGQ